MGDTLSLAGPSGGPDDFQVADAILAFLEESEEKYGMATEVMWAMLREAYEKRDGPSEGGTTFDEFCGALKWRAICEWDL